MCVWKTGCLQALCQPNKYKEEPYVTLRKKLFNLTEINIKRGKCWQRNGRLFFWFLKAESMGWPVKCGKLCLHLSSPCNIAFNPHRQWWGMFCSYRKRHPSLVNNSPPLHLSSSSPGCLRMNDMGSCFWLPWALLWRFCSGWEDQWGGIVSAQNWGQKFYLYLFCSFFFFF